MKRLIPAVIVFASIAALVFSASARWAHAETAVELGIAPGTPLLRIDRIAFGLDDRPIEVRVSLCHVAGMHYLARNG